MSNYSGKTGHPILGIVCGILGVLFAVLMTFITGIIGGGIALLLGVVAVLLGLSSRKKGGKGIGAVIIGALAILLAVIMTVSTINVFKAVQDAAAESDKAPLVVKCLDKPYLGFLGMILNIPKDEGTAQELLDQFNLLRNESEGTASPTAAPAGAAEETKTEETKTEETGTEEAAPEAAPEAETEAAPEG